VSDQPDAPSRPDPWRSFRGVMAGALILEAIVVLLALPVVSFSHGGLTTFSGGFLICFAVLLVLMCGVQGRPWALWADLALQLVLIAGFVIHAAIGFIGVVFLAVWALIAFLRAEVKRREARGLLPGQRDGQL
jgi:biotin transporter BioY